MLINEAEQEKLAQHLKVGKVPTEGIMHMEEEVQDLSSHQML